MNTRYKKQEKSLSAIGEEILQVWEKEQTYSKLNEIRANSPVFTFFEGPPTANGRPGIHHVLGRTTKDLFCRYKSMKGFRVDRKAGWDTHGLPVEIEVEKQLKLNNRDDIEAYGIANFNEKCKQSVNKYTADWNELTKRIGYWVDLQSPYVTYDNHYIESVWWLIKQLYKKDLLYRGHKIHWYSPGSGTVLSSHEVSLGYRDVQDPSIYVRFKLRSQENTFFLVWTTTPWTLFSNVCLAVSADVEYVKIRVEQDYIILARSCLAAISEDYEEVESYTGKQLQGLEYEPLFDKFVNDETLASCWRVVMADFVNTADGTGIVHIAPAFGEDDYLVASAEKMPIFNPVNREGRFEQDMPIVAGLWFKDADRPVCQNLRERGLLYRWESRVHSYPFDWRKGTPLVKYPVESWFVRTSSVKQRMNDLNNTINWIPDYVGSGRFGDWLANNVDWALSRHRYWGTPLPIWVNDNNPEDIEVIGSIEELKQKVGAAFPEQGLLDLHKPFIDEFSWPAKDGGTYRRVPEIIDVWFDSGSMPFAQWHYPFENKEMFEANFPADFIAEGIDQTRGWFYTMHALATCVMDSVAYKNVLVNGLLLDEKGNKMSKSKGNTVDPFKAMDSHGADVIRWYMMSNNPPWDNTKYSDKGVKQVSSKLFETLKNIYNFFATYANIDQYCYSAKAIKMQSLSTLNQWMLSRLNSTVKEVNESLDVYNPTKATRAIMTLVDDMSNWYIRRSRPIFWASKKGKDIAADEKNQTYEVTYFCLMEISKLIAPIAPFYGDWLYRALTNTNDSVHLCDYPEFNSEFDNQTLETQINFVRTAVTCVLNLRNEFSVNVRQPLARLLVVRNQTVENSLNESLLHLVLQETNVKKVEFLQPENDIVSRSAKANFAKLGKRLGKNMRAVAAAVAQLSNEEISSYEKHEKLSLQIAGEEIELSGDDILLESKGIEGWAVHSIKDITVALDMTLTEDLIVEGYVRETVNRIQNLRKEAGLDVTDRIAVQYAASEPLLSAIKNNQDQLAKEILATKISAASTPEGDVIKSWEVKQQSLTVGITVANV